LKLIFEEKGMHPPPNARPTERTTSQAPVLDGTVASAGEDLSSRTLAGNGAQGLRTDAKKLEIDPGTGAVRNLHTQNGVDYLREKFHGSASVIYFIDINGMGPTDKSGADVSKRVDQHIKDLVGISNAKFKNAGLECVITRLGGDEFGIVAEYRAGKTEQVIAEILNDLEIKRKEQFQAFEGRSILGRLAKPGAKLLRRFPKLEETLERYAGKNPLVKEFLLGIRVKRAQVFADYRTELRARAKKITSQCMEGISDKITGTADRETIFSAVQECVQSLIANKISNNPVFKGVITEQIIDRRLNGWTVMSPLIAASALVKEFKTAEDILLAFAQASKAATEIKTNTAWQERGRKIEIAQLSPIPGGRSFHKIRSADLEELRNAEIHERKIAALREAALLEDKPAENKRELKKAELQDPNIATQVLRKELLGGIRLGDVFDLQRDERLYGVKFQIPFFGLYNSVYDYARANEIYNFVAESINERFPQVLLIRQGGGDCMALSKIKIEGKDIANFTESLSKELERFLVETKSREVKELKGKINSYMMVAVQAEIRKLCDEFAHQIGLFEASEQMQDFHPGKITASSVVCFSDAKNYRPLEQYSL
jgi:GGDEF domain-containing protein